MWYKNFWEKLRFVIRAIRVLISMDKESMEFWVMPNNQNRGEWSDGYHTFNDLYKHRNTLFMMLCKALEQIEGKKGIAWKSKTHSNGESYENWFVAGINKNKGQQITYHLPIEMWDEVTSVEEEIAPAWDGHKPQDVVPRLKQLFN